MHHTLLHFYLIDEQYNQQQPTEHLELTFKNDMHPDAGTKIHYKQETKMAYPSKSKQNKPSN